MNADDTVHHFALPCVNSRHVDCDRPGLDPELPMPANERCDPGGINDILAWQAGHIGTRSADILPIDDGGPLSFFGHRPGRQFAGCAAAQHEDIEFFGSIHAIISGSPVYAARNCLTRAAVSSGFSSGKKWPPLIA